MGVLYNLVNILGGNIMDTKKMIYSPPTLTVVKIYASDVISTSNAYIEDDDNAWV